MAARKNKPAFQESGYDPSKDKYFITRLVIRRMLETPDNCEQWSIMDEHQDGWHHIGHTLEECIITATQHLRGRLGLKIHSGNPFESKYYGPNPSADERQREFEDALQRPLMVYTLNGKGVEVPGPVWMKKS